MRSSRILVLSLLIILTGSFALAQTGKVVKVKTSESAYKIKKGAAAQIAIVIDIDEGYHINSNRPAEAFLIATAVKFDRLAGVTPGRLVYPKAKIQKFEFSEKPMSVFEGQTILKFTARALPTAAPGSHTLKAKVTVQACNNEQCLRPQTLSLDIPVEVVN
jgi:thioredoxin:protein disulfide reductase